MKFVNDVNSIRWSCLRLWDSWPPAFLSPLRVSDVSKCAVGSAFSFDISGLIWNSTRWSCCRLWLVDVGSICYLRGSSKWSNRQSNFVRVSRWSSLSASVDLVRWQRFRLRRRDVTGFSELFLVSDVDEGNFSGFILHHGNVASNMEMCSRK